MRAGECPELLEVRVVPRRIELKRGLCVHQSRALGLDTGPQVRVRRGNVDPDLAYLIGDHNGVG